VEMKICRETRVFTHTAKKNLPPPPPVYGRAVGSARNKSLKMLFTRNGITATVVYRPTRSGSVSYT
jgi:hypothetical protein